jgi:hypothetical protein
MEIISMRISNLDIRRSVIIGLIFLLFSATAATGATYYVAPSGSDSNPGTKSRPWRHPEFAMGITSGVRAGDTVIVRDGTYTNHNRDKYVCFIRISGSDGNWITIKAENQGKAIIDGQTTLGSDSTLAGFRMDNQHHIRIEGFQIKRCHAGINYRDAHDIYIAGCEIKDIGRYWKIPGCDYDKRGDKYFAGITGNHLGYNITIDGNVIHNIGKLHNDSPCQYDYSYDHGLYLGGWNIIAQNNIIYDIHSGWPLKIDGHKDSGGRYGGTTHLITNNTFALKGENDGYETGINPGAQGAIVIVNTHGEYDPHNIVIQNNAFYDTPGTRAISVRYDVDLADSIFRNNASSHPDLWDRYGSGTATKSNTRPTESKNLISVALKNFGFADPRAKDFRIASSESYLIDNATDRLAPDLDYAQIARQDSSCDIGAYQYTSESVLTPPTGLKIIASP